MNYYKLLEISPGASFEVIKIAYNIACEKYRENDEKINLLKVAYVTLTNKTTREKYDMLLPHIEYREEQENIEKLKKELEQRKNRAELKLQYERMSQDAKSHAEQRKNVNYYELLGVASTASTELITVAYRVAREKYFYDEEKMQMLLIAYETLTDETIRKEYDMVHANATSAAQVPANKKKESREENTEEMAKSREQQENVKNKEFKKRYIEQERRMNQEIFYARKQLDDQRAARMEEGLNQFREKEKEDERKKNKLKLTEDERLAVIKRREEQAKRWKEQGLCEHCGGKLSLFGRKCKSCKR